MFGGPKCGQIVAVPDGMTRYEVRISPPISPAMLDQASMPDAWFTNWRVITYRIEPVWIDWRPCNVVLYVGWIYERPTQGEIFSRVSPEELDILAIMQRGEAGGPHRGQGPADSRRAV